MHIKRDIDKFLAKRMFDGKALVIYGPRQSGKTTAVETYLASNGLSDDVATFNGDETADREMLADASAEKIRMLLGGKKILFIDEAHKVPEIGLVLKRVWDKLKDIQTIASGSSSVELADKIEEPMTGRKFDYTLMPLSFAELAGVSSPVEEMRQFERRMVYGTYPDVVTHPGDEVERLRMIGKGYLYKDILSFGEIKRPEVLDKILRALAFQVGQEVSYNELAHLCGTDDKTCEGNGCEYGALMMLKKRNEHYLGKTPDNNYNFPNDDDIPNDNDIFDRGDKARLEDESWDGDYDHDEDWDDDDEDDYKPRSPSRRRRGGHSGGRREYDDNNELVGCLSYLIGIIFVAILVGIALSYET